METQQITDRYSLKNMHFKSKLIERRSALLITKQRTNLYTCRLLTGASRQRSQPPHRRCQSFGSGGRGTESARRGASRAGGTEAGPATERSRQDFCSFTVPRITDSLSDWVRIRSLTSGLLSRDTSLLIAPISNPAFAREEKEEEEGKSNAFAPRFSVQYQTFNCC